MMADKICPKYKAALLMYTEGAANTESFLYQVVKCDGDDCQLWWFCSGMKLADGTDGSLLDALYSIHDRLSERGK